MGKTEIMGDDLRSLAKTMEDRLRLPTRILGYRRLQKVEDLETLPGVRTFRNKMFTMCQLVTLARVQGWMVAATNQGQRKGGPADDRCARNFGFQSVTPDTMDAEAQTLSRYWFASFEDARRQQEYYPRLSPAEAVVLAPLAHAPFDPDVVLLYGNPAQLMLLLSAMQRERYEYFEFSFIGEGACSDSLAQCLVKGKPALAIPCYGERSLGGVTDDEIVLALPPGEMGRALAGLQHLKDANLGYPIRRRAAEMDLTESYRERYPNLIKE
jgi:uncharacterized protein (DUF169 family)